MQVAATFIKSGLPSLNSIWKALLRQGQILRALCASAVKNHSRRPNELKIKNPKSRMGRPTHPIQELSQRLRHHFPCMHAPPDGGNQFPQPPRPQGQMKADFKRCAFSGNGITTQ
jgi:hypothetical protein